MATTAQKRYGVLETCAALNISPGALKNAISSGKMPPFAPLKGEQEPSHLSLPFAGASFSRAWIDAARKLLAADDSVIRAPYRDRVRIPVPLIGEPEEVVVVTPAQNPQPEATPPADAPPSPADEQLMTEE